MLINIVYYILIFRCEYQIANCIFLNRHFSRSVLSQFKGSIIGICLSSASTSVLPVAVAVSELTYYLFDEKPKGDHDFLPDWSRVYSNVKLILFGPMPVIHRIYNLFQSLLCFCNP